MHNASSLIPKKGISYESLMIFILTLDAKCIKI